MLTYVKRNDILFITGILLSDNVIQLTSLTYSFGDKKARIIEPVSASAPRPVQKARWGYHGMAKPSQTP